MPKPGEAEQDEDVLELTEEQQFDEGDKQNDQDSESGADGDGEQAGDDEGGEGDEETIVSFGEPADADQEGDSTVIRSLRKELREAKERARTLEKAAPAVKRELRPEPTSADHAFDDDAFKADYKAWLTEKADIETENSRVSEAQAINQREWEGDVQRFETEKAELKFDDLEDAQDTIASSFNLAQQAVIVKAAEKPALLMYALAKSPAKLAELAKIQDVIKLAAAIAKMEGTVKVTKRRKGPAIDRAQSGSSVLVASDKRLAQLEKKADETGDRTELVNYRRELARKRK